MLHCTVDMSMSKLLYCANSHYTYATLGCTVLYYTVLDTCITETLYCTKSEYILCYAILYTCILLHYCTALNLAMLCYAILYCTVLYCTKLNSIAVNMHITTMLYCT